MGRGRGDVIDAGGGIVICWTTVCSVVGELKLANDVGAVDGAVRCTL